MQLSPQGPLQLQQMGGTHSFHPPEAGKINRQSFLYCSMLKDAKTLPASPKQECWLKKSAVIAKNKMSDLGGICSYSVSQRCQKSHNNNNNSRIIAFYSQETHVQLTPAASHLIARTSWVWFPLGPRWTEHFFSVWVFSGLLRATNNRILVLM